LSGSGEDSGASDDHDTHRSYRRDRRGAAPGLAHPPTELLNPVTFGSGTPFHIDEVLEQGQAMLGRSVKLLGRVTQVDHVTQLSILEFKGRTIRVSTAMLDIGKQPIFPGRMYHMIGELQSSSREEHDERAVAGGGGSGVLELRARVACTAREIDEELHVRALELQRARQRL